MEVIDKWVAEFFLRRQQNPRVHATTLFSALKLSNSDDCAKLKIAAVLRDISDSLIRGKVDESMLDLLEILEKLLPQPSSLKSAYCWTAVESTARFMWPVSASGGLFSDALCRIWKERVGRLKERESDLVTGELLNWEIDLVKALEEDEIYQKIRESNVRYIAISHLNEVLKEQWGLLGSSSLESEARKRFLKRKDVDAAGERANDVEEGRHMENGVDKVNEQEQEQEENVAVARELKDYLLEIQRVIDSSARQREGSSNPVDVTPRDGEEHNEAEVSQGTSSSSSFRRVRPRLPTPEPLYVSPLKRGKLPASPRPRRKMRFWTPEELQALKEGVKKYGKSWKAIKNSNPVVLADRTEVDLKDKWRNYFGR